MSLTFVEMKVKRAYIAKYRLNADYNKSSKIAVITCSGCDWFAYYNIFKKFGLRKHILFCRI
jgi:hypothetical protein